MKVFKKILSVFLTAVIMVSMVCVGTASAGAAESDLPYVEKYVNNYYKTLSYTFWLKGVQKEMWNKDDSYNYKCSHGYYFGFFYRLVLEDNADTYELQCLRFKDSAIVVLIDNGKAVKTNIGLTSTEAGWEYGFTFTISTDNPYYEKLKKCTKASTYNCMLYDTNCPNEDTCGNICCADGSKNGSEIALTDIEIHDLNAKVEEIVNKNKTKISSLKISAPKNYTYTGKNRKATVTVKDGDYTLKNGTDYTLSYKNCKEIGTATVTIKGKGDYTGTKTLTYKIVPKKTTLKASKKSSSKVTLSWSAVSGAEKYQIYYSVNGGKYKKLSTVSGSKTSTTISKLDFEKNDYKFKVRSYGTDDGAKYYSSFSNVKTVK